MNELFRYYNLDEAIDRALLIRTLVVLRDDLKIEFSIEGDILEISDIELEEHEVDSLLDLLDDNDIFPHLEIDEDDEDYEDFYDSDYDLDY